MSRTDAPVTMREWAAVMGISAATIWRFSAGKDVDIQTLLKILNASDPALAHEVETCIAYWRAKFARRAKQ